MSSEQDAGKNHEVKLRQAAAEAFVVAGQAAKPAAPNEAAFDHPAARQQHEADLARRLFNHLPVTVVHCGGAFGFFARGALVYEADPDGLVGDGRHPFAQLAHLAAFLRIGRRDNDTWQLPGRVNGAVGLAAFAPLAAAVAGPVPARRPPLQPPL